MARAEAAPELLLLLLVLAPALDAPGAIRQHSSCAQTPAESHNAIGTLWTSNAHTHTYIYIFTIIISLFISCVEASATSFVDGAILIQFTAYQQKSDRLMYTLTKTNKLLVKINLRFSVCSKNPFNNSLKSEIMAQQP